jgi:hypothetical protein
LGTTVVKVHSGVALTAFNGTKDQQEKYQSVITLGALMEIESYPGANLQQIEQLVAIPPLPRQKQVAFLFFFATLGWRWLYPSQLFGSQSPEFDAVLVEGGLEFRKDRFQLSLTRCDYFGAEVLDMVLRGGGRARDRLLQAAMARHTVFWVGPECRSRTRNNLQLKQGPMSVGACEVILFPQGLRRIQRPSTEPSPMPARIPTSSSDSVRLYC